MDAVLDGATAVETLRRLGKALQEGPTVEQVHFFWESACIRRAHAGHDPESWWSQKNHIALEKRQIAPSVDRDLSKIIDWITACPNWESEQFVVLLAVRDDEMGGLL